MKFLTKKNLKNQLIKEMTEKLRYKNRLSMIEYKLREQKETNGNVFTLIRDLNMILKGDVILEEKICPRCGNSYLDYPAISRKDNKTEICPTCGQAEALLQLSGKDLKDDRWKIYKVK